MKLSRLMVATLVVGLLTLSGCMLGHVFNSDEGSGMHSGMHDGGMMHSGAEDE